MNQEEFEFNYEFLHRLAKITRRLTEEIIINNYNLSEQQNLIRLCNNQRLRIIHKNNYIFSLNIRKSNTNLVERINDIFLGFYFPSLEDIGYVEIYKMNNINAEKILFRFTPKNKIYVGFDDLIPHITIGHIWMNIFIRIFNKNGDDITNVCEYYKINAYVNIILRDNLAIKYKNINTPYYAHEYCDGLYKKIDHRLDIGNLNLDLPDNYLLRISINVIRKFIKKFYYYYKHKQKHQQVILELEYHPDFGQKSKEIIRSLKRQRLDHSFFV
jgi:hypothetical protein